MSACIGARDDLCSRILFTPNPFTPFINYRRQTVNKGELIEAIATSCDINKAKAEQALSAVINAISGELKSGGSVQLVGFGTFKVAARAARTAKNPRTGATVKVAATKVPKFTAGAGLKDLVAGRKKAGAAKAGAAKGAAKAGAAKGAAKGKKK